jgi:hypothetical protein
MARQVPRTKQKIEAKTTVGIVTCISIAFIISTFPSCIKQLKTSPNAGPRCFAFACRCVSRRKARQQAKQNGGGGIIRQESSKDMAVNYEILCARA